MEVRNNILWRSFYVAEAFCLGKSKIKRKLCVIQHLMSQRLLLACTAQLGSWIFLGHIFELCVVNVV